MQESELHSQTQGFKTETVSQTNNRRFRPYIQMRNISKQWKKHWGSDLNACSQRSATADTDAGKCEPRPQNASLINSNYLILSVNIFLRCGEQCAQNQFLIYLAKAESCQITTLRFLDSHSLSDAYVPQKGFEARSMTTMAIRNPEMQRFHPLFTLESHQGNKCSIFPMQRISGSEQKRNLHRD